MKVTLQSFGASRTVTGSRHLIRAGETSFMLDCGMFQGRRHESREKNRHIPVKPDAVVLSHAHLDHCGALPTLVRDGFSGPIHATDATVQLCHAMLMDAARIAESDARYLNKKRGRGEPEVEPIYTQKDAEKTLRLFVRHPYDEVFQVGKGVVARFQDAGHIIGSAGVHIETDGGPSIYFTGDVGRRMYPILRDPVPIPDVDTVLSECTYGTRDHPDPTIAEGRLQEIVKQAVADSGKILIPAFSVGRTQNIVYALAQMWHEGSAPRIPVYVDSPLAEKATRVFVDHPECYDAEVESFMMDGGRPFHPKGVHYTESVQDSKALNSKKGPFIVIAGSGMCEGGRILHHLKHNLGSPETTVLFVGWCAPHTLGRRILEGRERVRIYGREIRVRAQVERINAYSAHAGRTDLLELLAPLKERRSSIYLVHGDEDTALSFAGTLRERGHHDVVVPETYATYDLERRS